MLRVKGLMRRVVILLILSAMVAACGDRPSSPTPSRSQTSAPASAPVVSSPRTTTIVGTFTLRGGVVRRDDVGCYGTGDHRDIGTGASVVVTDPDGTVVGRAELTDAPRPSTAAEYLACVYRFTIAGLPDLPSVALDLPGFGSVTYTREDLRVLGRDMQFGIGGPAPDAVGLPALTVAQIGAALGLTCAPETLMGGDVVPWMCLASDGPVRYAAQVLVAADGRVLALHAVVAQTASEPSTDVARAFLDRVAMLPYTGSDPKAARTWLSEDLEVGGTTVIGGVRYFIGQDWPEETRGLSLESP